MGIFTATGLDEALGSSAQGKAHSGMVGQSTGDMLTLSAIRALWWANIKSVSRYEWRGSRLDTDRMSKRKGEREGEREGSRQTERDSEKKRRKCGIEMRDKDRDRETKMDRQRDRDREIET